MSATALLLPLTDSFVSACAALGSGTLAVVTMDRDEMPPPAAEALIIAAASIEAEAVPYIRDFRTVFEKIAVVGSSEDYRVAMEIIRSGADSYFCLPQDFADLRLWINDIACSVDTRAARKRLAEQHKARYDFRRFLGSSGALQEALHEASQVIQHEHVNVLITGETGTGKELLAQAIHYNSPRLDRPLVEINCAALPSALLEAELFGYERGAFTDARETKPGIFEVANGGTIFLDEIGEMSPELQTKLLRAIESKRIRRLGAVTENRLDLRFIAATNADLAEEISSRRFRADLYFRLGTVKIELPPLRARGKDVIQIAEVMLDELSSSYGLPRPSISFAAKRRMLEYHWPGNIRELKNIIERSVVMECGEIQLDDIGTDLLRTEGFDGFGSFESLDELVHAAAKNALAASGGNKSAAASRLKISRKRLYSILQEDSGRKTEEVRHEDL